MDNYSLYKKYKIKYLGLRQYNLSGGSMMKGGHNKPVKFPFPVEDEIYFWGHQLTEHAFLLYAGLLDESLKTQAKQLHDLWNSFMVKYFTDKYDKDDKVFLTANELESVKIQNISEVKDLIQKTSDYNKKLISLLGGNFPSKSQDRDVNELNGPKGKITWMGWIFLSIIKHMQEETEYFERKVKGEKISIDEEIYLANHHHHTELAATAQLIDPDDSQQALIQDIKNSALKGKELYIGDINKSIQYGNDVIADSDKIGKGIDSGSILTVIPSVLAHHNHREFIRYTKTLEGLAGKL